MEATRPVITADTSIKTFVAAVAERSPTPGGGSVVPVVAALAAALGAMVVNYSTGKPKLAEHAPLHEEAQRDLERLAEIVLEQADADIEAYRTLNELMRLDADDPQRTGAWADAVDGAIAAPYAVLHSSIGILHLLERLHGATSRMLGSDLRIAAILAEAAVRAAACNVRVNLPQLDDVERRRDIEAQLVLLLDRAKRHMCAVLGE